ncbi:MAG: FHA domain-containing protein, partial [Deltaproteobacteria bacterium]|nr:FHA domain-containing protein [Deltaproteobacteria bacterium]
SLTLDGETYHFTLQFLPEIRIGRSQAADISIDDPLASKNHAKIIRKDEKYYIVDENSSNGTFIQRGERALAIKKGRSAELLDGDVILIGRKKLAVSLPFQRPKYDAPTKRDRSGEIVDVKSVEIEGTYPRVEEAKGPPIDSEADPIMSKSMVVPVGTVSERPIESEPVEIFVRGEGRLEAGKYVGSIERVLVGEEWKFRFTDDTGASRIIDPKDIVAISRRNGSESNRKLNQQFVRSSEPQFKQGACNVSRKGKMIIVDFRDKRLTKFLEERIRPVYDKLIAGKINKEAAAREAWAVVSKFTDYDYAHAGKGIPNYVRLTDSETRELVLDPQYDKPLSPDDNLFYDYQDDGTPFDLEGVTTGVIGLR